MAGYYPNGAVALDKCQRAVMAAGYRLSLGSYYDDDSGVATAFSVETCGPATYNAPCLVVQAFRQPDGRWRIY